MPIVSRNWLCTKSSSAVKNITSGLLNEEQWTSSSISKAAVGFILGIGFEFLQEFVAIEFSKEVGATELTCLNYQSITN